MKVLFRCQIDPDSMSNPAIDEENINSERIIKYGDAWFVIGHIMQNSYGEMRIQPEDSTATYKYIAGTEAINLESWLDAKGINIFASLDKDTRLGGDILMNPTGVEGNIMEPTYTASYDVGGFFRYVHSGVKITGIKV